VDFLALGCVPNGLQGGSEGNGGEWETGKNGKHRGTEGTEKRGREERGREEGRGEEGRGEERGREEKGREEEERRGEFVSINSGTVRAFYARKAVLLTECFFAAGLALGLGELCAFAVSLEPTGRLAPFRLDRV